MTEGTSSERRLMEGEATRLEGQEPVRADADDPRLGVDCCISNGAIVEAGAVLGDRVKIGRVAQICAGVVLEDDVLVGPQAIFTGASTRGSLDRGGPARTVVRAGASVGANATILGGIEIGRGASISAGAVVTESVPPHVVVAGNPARIQAYIDSVPSETGGAAPLPERPGRTPLGVRGVHIQRFAEFSDLRGRLTAGDLPNEGVPFVPRRWFLVYDVPSSEIRGGHAHRACHQFLICVSGRVSVAVDDGRERAEVLLDKPVTGLYVPPLAWASQFGYDERSVLLVFASHPYDPDDYIRDYGEFLLEVADREPTGGSEQ